MQNLIRSGLKKKLLSWTQFYKKHRPTVRDVLNGIALTRLGILDPIYCFRKEQIDVSDAIYFAMSWRTSFHPRKPYPGFNPAVYRQKMNLSLRRDPTLHYFSRGRPEGAWSKTILKHPPSPGSVEIRSAIHIHVFYEDLFDDILSRIINNHSRPDLYVTLVGTEKKSAIETSLIKYAGQSEIIVLNQNLGRDIGPFFTALPSKFFHDYEVIGHVHTKRSLDYNDEITGSIWYTFIADNLLGAVLHSRNLDVALRAFENNPNLALIYADDPNAVGWSQNYTVSRELFSEAVMPKEHELFDFPVGNFFLARTRALEPIIGLDLTEEDLPKEPIAYDGTVLHALERLVGLAPELNQSEYESASVMIEQTTR